MRALVIKKSGQPLEIEQIPTPEAVPGSIIVKVLAANLEPNMRKILSGQAGFGFPEPMVPGARGAGRVATTGPDTTSLIEGQLVLLEPLIRARDDPNVFGLLGAYDGHTLESKKWESSMRRSWLTVQAVALGGLQGIGLKPRETIIVAPATGVYSSAAVVVADAMGANVTACGRNIKALKKLEETFPRIRIVQFKGDVEEDTAEILKHGPIDAYIELSPPEASESTQLRSYFTPPGQRGRVALVGGSTNKDLHVSHMEAIFKNLTIYGSMKYERKTVRRLIKMAESGLLKLGKSGGQEIVGQFPREEVEKWFEASNVQFTAGQMTVLVL